MTRPRTHLPEHAQAFLAIHEGGWRKSSVRHFHRWMSAQNFSLADLTAEHLEDFWKYEPCRKLAASTMRDHRCTLRGYLRWLFKHGYLHLAVEPPRMRKTHAPLPDHAMRFIELFDDTRRAPVIRTFHRWLSREQITLDEVTPDRIEDFLRRPGGMETTKSSSRTLLCRLKPYLLWLHDHGILSFRFARQSSSRRGRAAGQYPASVLAFLDTCHPVLKPSSVEGYRYALRGFHSWLNASNLDLARFDRAAAELWLQSLAARGLVPTTRCACVFMVRRYLEWLVERGEFDAWPYDLLRKNDLPKIPNYLPRPFPVDADRELQRRFLESGTVYGQALFLMRRSGVRIGELVRLEPQCLVRDLRDNVFLKVPLGKLDNERLVPLGDEARDVLLALQSRCSPGVAFLICPDITRDSLKGRLGAALKKAALGLDIQGAVGSHRLRHTYATELLNAGLSLVTIMKLLGHQSFRMTMRYAAIAQQTIVEDYRAAMSVIADRYNDVDTSSHAGNETTPERQALDLISCLRKSCASSPDAKRRADAIIKRIYKIHDDLLALPRSTQHA